MDMGFYFPSGSSPSLLPSSAIHFGHLEETVPSVNLLGTHQPTSSPLLVFTSLTRNKLSHFLIFLVATRSHLYFCCSYLRFTLTASSYSSKKETRLSTVVWEDSRKNQKFSAEMKLTHQRRSPRNDDGFPTLQLFFLGMSKHACLRAY
jgi:hypothetical protein